jgi:hypothetical protein
VLYTGCSMHMHAEMLAGKLRSLTNLGSLDWKSMYMTASARRAKTRKIAIRSFQCITRNDREEGCQGHLRHVICIA